PHHPEAVLVDEVTLLVDREVTGPSVRGCAGPGGVADHEEAVPVDGDIESPSGGLKRALREVGCGRDDLAPHPDLLGERGLLGGEVCKTRPRLLVTDPP